MVGLWTFAIPAGGTTVPNSPSRPFLAARPCLPPQCREACALHPGAGCEVIRRCVNPVLETRSALDAMFLIVLCALNGDGPPSQTGLGHHPPELHLGRSRTNTGV